MILGKCITNQLSLFINGIKIERTSEVVLLEITIDDQLTFKTHLEYICRMAKYKLRALQRIRNCLSTEKARLFWIETNQCTKTSTFFGHGSL